VDADHLQLGADVRPPNRAGIAMTTVNYRIGNHSFTDACVFYTVANGINDAKKFMTDNARIFGERIMPTKNMYV
jgi:hypothetical protein